MPFSCLLPDRSWDRERHRQSTARADERGEHRDSSVSAEKPQSMVPMGPPKELAEAMYLAPHLSGSVDMHSALTVY